MSKEIGVGVVGFGLGGRVFHAPFVSAVPGLNLVAILQRTGDEAAKAYPATKIVRSLDEMLGDASIELVVVSTPNETHFRMAMAGLDAGKHVVIDKPFAATSDEAAELGQVAKAKGVLVIPFHNRRWDGDFLTVRKLIEEKAVGRLVTFESHFDRFRPIPRENTWKEAGNPANGMLFDLGPHLVDQCLALFGAPDALTGSVRSDRDETAIEDAFDITLHYPKANGKGLLAHCRTSYLACDNAPRFLLHGTHGSFKEHGLDPQEPALVHGAKVPPMGSSEVWLREDETLWGTLTTAPNPADPAMLVRREIKTEPGDYRGFYANVRDAVLGKAEPAVTAEDGYRVSKLLEMARELSEGMHAEGEILRRLIGCTLLLGSNMAAMGQAAPNHGDATMLLPQMNLHDPFILAYAPTKTYYLYTSNQRQMTQMNRTGTMAYTSKDLKHWTAPKVVFTVPDGFWAEDGGWAPEVHEYKGKFYLFTTIHNEKKEIKQEGRPVGHPTYMRGTIIAVSDSPDGPFVPVKKDGPIAPANFMTLDGTLYVDRAGKPWMVYAHEWLQATDGKMEAVPLKDDLTDASGPPISLFKASDAPWLDAQAVPNARGSVYVTDGPELFRSKDGHLLMLWSSYENLSDNDGNSHYVETVARSQSGEIKGPWVQLEPLVHQDSGHGMLFRTFDGQLMMVLHRPFKRARGKLYEMRDAGDHLEIVKERVDLDGDVQ